MNTWFLDSELSTCLSYIEGKQEPELVEKKGTTSHVWTFLG